MQRAKQRDDCEQARAVLRQRRQAVDDARRAKRRFFLRAVQGVEKIGVFEILQVHRRRFALHNAAHAVLHRQTLPFGHIARQRVRQRQQQVDGARQHDQPQHLVPPPSARHSRRKRRAFFQAVEDARDQAKRPQRQKSAHRHKHNRSDHPARPAAPHQKHRAPQ